MRGKEFNHKKDIVLVGPKGHPSLAFYLTHKEYTTLQSRSDRIKV